jgi:hypothetical protein
MKQQFVNIASVQKAGLFAMVQTTSEVSHICTEFMFVRTQNWDKTRPYKVVHAVLRDVEHMRTGGYRTT